jgi:hypothetical protein
MIVIDGTWGALYTVNDVYDTRLFGPSYQHELPLNTMNMNRTSLVRQCAV